jgi:murein DD-endopeptidase MepM/ murein hydrolase activator NlpD
MSIAGSLILAASAIVPVRADTARELASAKDRLAMLQQRLNGLAAQYDAAQATYARIESQMAGVHGRIGILREQVAGVQQQVRLRARQAYEFGGGGTTIDLLLSSDSLAQFADRVQLLGQMSRQDSDLLVQAGVNGEQLRRSEADLARLAAQQAGTVRSLGATKDAIAQAFADQQAEVADLQARVAAEQAAAAASQPEQGPVGRGVLAACPVGQPRAFGDDFGDPRPGGRTHQGIDMLAPLGTPVYAAQTGRFEENDNALGGTSALVFADNGDFTYYAHLSAYAGVPSGAHVAAGAEIGHVGNSGDARGGPYHLHFEYHPGGGSAVDPYRLLLAACG